MYYFESQYKEVSSTQAGGREEEERKEKRENRKETGEGERRKRGERKETEEEERGEEEGKRRGRGGETLQSLFCEDNSSGKSAPKVKGMTIYVLLTLIPTSCVNPGIL